MEIKKGNINLCEQVAKSVSNVLVEGDLILPDTKPDMAEILIADAKAKVASSECKNSSLVVTGEVVFTALYIPDDSGEIKMIEQVFPFSQTLDVRCTEGTQFKADARVEHIGFTLVNSRKVSAKVMLALATCGTQKNCYEPVIEVAGNDIECRDKKYSIYIPMSETDTKIAVSDILTVPQNKPDIGEILKVNAYVTPHDVKVMNGKAMAHAELHINTVYTGAENGELSGVHHSVPFTEVVEAPGADEQSVVRVSYEVESICANTKGDLNGDTKIISIDAEICAKVSVSKTVSEKIVDDCYFMDAKTEISRKNMKINEYVTSESARVSVHSKVEAPKNVIVNEVIDCCVKPLPRECIWENGKAKVKGNLIASLIYRDDSGTVRSGVSESDINWEKAISDPCCIETDMWIDTVNCDVNETGIEISTNVGLYAKALKSRNIDIIEDIQAKEMESHEKPSMVIYFAKDGDTLWSIAKKYRTRADKIKRANNLEGEKLETGRRLLIPKA